MPCNMMAQDSKAAEGRGDTPQLSPHTIKSIALHVLLTEKRQQALRYFRASLAA